MELSYFKKPVYIYSSNQASNFWRSIKEVIYSYLIAISFIIVSLFLILLVDYLLVNVFHHPSIRLTLINRRSINNSNSLNKITIILIAPVIEEICFRYPLNLKKGAIITSLTIIFFIFFGGSFSITAFFTVANLKKLIISFIISFFIGLMISGSLLENIKEKYFHIYFYLIAFSFSFLHISNFHPFYYSLFFLYPIYVIPQFLMGMFIGYVRIKCGFAFGVLLHMLFNVVSVLLT